MAYVRLEPWSAEDLPLLRMLLGDPQMMAHLGGLESEEQIVRRHQRYLHLPDHGTDRMFKILWGPSSEAVGSVGYWRKTWRDKAVYERGWLVLPGYQGHGIATKAARAAIDLARQDGKYRYVHAFPSVENAASNAICRKLGFTLIEESRVEYPPGHPMTVNDWRLDLLNP